MRSLVVGVAGGLLSAVAWGGPAGVGPLVWQDEFGGTQLDASRWAYYPWETRDDARVTPDAVTVADGMLRMRVYTENGVHHTGYIMTQRRDASGTFGEMLYGAHFGYVEARIMFHTAPGSWSAFWSNSPTHAQPIGDPERAGMEIDIVEHRAANGQNNPILRRYNAGVHWDGYGPDHKSHTQFLPRQEGLGNDSWHTYGLLWTPTSYTFYYDGNPVWEMPGEVPVSQRSQYLILSSEVRDNGWAGIIPAEGYGSRDASPNGMWVDYVRVYAIPEPSVGLAGALAGAAMLRRRR